MQEIDSAANDNSMLHPEEQATDSDGTPKFGRLLLVLALSLLIVVGLTFGSMMYYTQ